MQKQKDERDKEVKDGWLTQKGQGSERMTNLRQEMFFFYPLVLHPLKRVSIVENNSCCI